MNSKLLNTKYQLICFDVDDTLTKSKSRMTDNMARPLIKLLNKYKVGILTSGGFQQIERDILKVLEQNGCKKDTFKNLYIFPVSGAECILWNKDNETFELEYKMELSLTDRKTIISRIKKLISDHKELQVEPYGEQIEDRVAQITFSVFGQDAPKEIKHDWDVNMNKRKLLVKELSKDLSAFEIKIAGSNSIDISIKGLDKEFGMKKLIELTGISKDLILYLGDNFQENGNDLPVIKTGVATLQVSSLDETLEIITTLLI